jgi:hypothetical protein
MIIGSDGLGDGDGVRGRDGDLEAVLAGVASSGDVAADGVDVDVCGGAEVEGAEVAGG